MNGDAGKLAPPPGSCNPLDPARRRFLQTSAALLAGVTAPAFAQESDFWNLPRELWLYRPDTREQVRATYWADGELVYEGYAAICRLLRDTHHDKAVMMDVTILDIARGVYGWLEAFGVARPLIINSGYRDPSTNAQEGGVRNSLHTQAKAIDLRIEGVAAEKVSQFGAYLAGGGVGFYPSRGFTHLDCGRLRHWRG